MLITAIGLTCNKFQSCIKRHAHKVNKVLQEAGRIPLDLKAAIKQLEISGRKPNQNSNKTVLNFNMLMRIDVFI